MTALFWPLICADLNYKAVLRNLTAQRYRHCERSEAIQRSSRWFFRGSPRG